MEVSKIISFIGLLLLLIALNSNPLYAKGQPTLLEPQKEKLKNE